MRRAADVALIGNPLYQSAHAKSRCTAYQLQARCELDILLQGKCFTNAREKTLMPQMRAIVFYP